jgi:hypothetical protein
MENCTYCNIDMEDWEGIFDLKLLRCLYPFPTASEIEYTRQFWGKKVQISRCPKCKVRTEIKLKDTCSIFYFKLTSKGISLLNLQNKDLYIPTDLFNLVTSLGRLAIDPTYNLEKEDRNKLSELGYLEIISTTQYKAECVEEAEKLVKGV